MFSNTGEKNNFLKFKKYVKIKSMENIEKIQRAIKFAIKTHEVYQKQTRKGKKISYITHPLTVGIILSQISNDVDLICAGILHDTIEDSIPEKKVNFSMLEERFGEKVAQMVLDVSEKDKTASWLQRKQEARNSIKKLNSNSLLLKSADIVSNVSEIIDDFNKKGDIIFKKFNAPEPKKENILNNYINFIKTILDHSDKNPLEKELIVLIDKLKNI